MDTSTPVAAQAEQLQVTEGGQPLEVVRGTRAADLDLRRTVLWWKGFEDQVVSRQQELHGIGADVVLAAQAADTALQESPPRLAGEVFSAVAEGFSTVPGEVPRLLVPWFGELARSIGREVSTRALADAAGAGVTAVQRAGAPPAGTPSLLDALIPAAGALVGAETAGVPAVAALHAAYRAAADGTRRTVDGGTVDPGALLVAWFFERGTVV